MKVQPLRCLFESLFYTSARFTHCFMSSHSVIYNLLTKSVSRVIDRENLEKRLLAGEKLVVKLGIDPVASKIHLGHMIPFLKLKQFQELGHTVVLLFGDATAQV